MSYPPSGFFDLTKVLFPETVSVPHTKASHTARILGRIREHRPDIVVFQLGNYENPYPLFDRLRKKLLRAFGMADSAASRPMPYFLGIPMPLKIPLDGILGALGLGIGNPRHFNRAIETTLRETVRAMPQGVIALSPFPSLDPWIQYGRARAGNRMRALCAELQIRYIDLFELPGHSAGDFYGKDDAFHFDEKGQRLLHELLVPEIRALLERQV